MCKKASRNASLFYNVFHSISLINFSSLQTRDTSWFISVLMGRSCFFFFTFICNANKQLLFPSIICGMDWNSVAWEIWAKVYFVSSHCIIKHCNKTFLFRMFHVKMNLGKDNTHVLHFHPQRGEVNVFQVYKTSSASIF